MSSFSIICWAIVVIIVSSWKAYQMGDRKGFEAGVRMGLFGKEDDNDSYKHDPS